MFYFDHTASLSNILYIPFALKFMWTLLWGHIYPWDQDSVVEWDLGKGLENTRYEHTCEMCSEVLLTGVSPSLEPLQ